MLLSSSVIIVLRWLLIDSFNDLIILSSSLLLLNKLFNSFCKTSALIWLISILLTTSLIFSSTTI